MSPNRRHRLRYVLDSRSSAGKGVRGTIRRGLLVGVVLAAVVVPAARPAGLVIPLFDEPAFCAGVPITPVNNTYVIDASCIVSFQIVWPPEMVTAHLEGSADGGTTWVDLGDPPGRLRSG